MIINTEIIAELNPCQSRFNNYKSHYPYFEGDLLDFILLENITYEDKVWVVTRLFTVKQNIKWSILCASKVLSIFESQSSEQRPRLALEAAEKYLKEPTKENAKAAYAAGHAAYAAGHVATSAASAAYAAAYAAYAAAYAAHDSDAAVNAAACAADGAYAAGHVATSAASAAYAAAYVAHDSRDTEEEVNLILMLECLTEEDL